MSRTKEYTRQDRIKIGFPKNSREWQDLPASFERRRLIINNHPVMEGWERGYMLRLAEVAGSKGGKVLEVGFGMGISARFLQRLEIEEHLIIEANRAVYQKLLAFSKRARRPTTPLLGFWEEVAEGLPVLERANHHCADYL